MHPKHSAYTGPTCALHAPFVSHTFQFSFDLGRAKKVNARTPNERSNEATTTNAMHACDMTLTYLRGGLSTCSVMWGYVQYVFLKFVKVLMQLCKNFFYKV